MSYQGTMWAQAVRGVNRGEKALLMQLAAPHDQRTNVIRISRAELAEAAVMSERQVIRVLQQLEEKRILKRIGGGVGKGNISLYSFVGFSPSKGDILSNQKVTSATLKGDIPASKGDIPDTLIRNIRTAEELQETINPPYPPFSKGGLTPRQLKNLSDEMNRMAAAAMGAGFMSERDLLQRACQKLLIPFDPAYEALWQTLPPEDRKPVRPAVVAS